MSHTCTLLCVSASSVWVKVEEQVPILLENLQCRTNTLTHAINDGGADGQQCSRGEEEREGVMLQHRQLEVSWRKFLVASRLDVLRHKYVAAHSGHGGGVAGDGGDFHCTRCTCIYLNKQYIQI